MTNKLCNVSVFENLIQLAGWAINKPESDICERFNSEQHCHTHSIGEGEDHVVEIRMDNFKVTLTCQMNGRCRQCLLFFDQSVEADNFLLYIYEAYPYDMLLNRWKLPGSYLKTSKMVNDLIFIFSSRE